MIVAVQVDSSVFSLGPVQSRAAACSSWRTMHCAGYTFAILHACGGQILVTHHISELGSLWASKPRIREPHHERLRWDRSV